MAAEVPQDPSLDPVHSLEEALQGMVWRREEGLFALLGFPEPPFPADLIALSGSGPAQGIREGGETTLLLPAAEAEAAFLRHPQAQNEGPLVWVRFELPLAWDLVGFLAHVTGAMERAGIPVGAISGFSRDHLFFAADAWPRAAAVLSNLFGPPQAPPEARSVPPIGGAAPPRAR